MKVIILTEGGKNMGIGHLARCLSLYQAFEDKNINAEIIVNGDKTLKDSLSIVSSGFILSFVMEDTPIKKLF